MLFSHFSTAVKVSFFDASLNQNITDIMVLEQLQKMGILASSSTHTTPASVKRKSVTTDFSKLGPLNKYGTVGFSGYRDNAGSRKSSRADPDAMDSDDDDDNERARDDVEDADAKDENGHLLSPEDARKQEEVAEGVRKIKVRSHLFSIDLFAMLTISIAQASALCRATYRFGNQEIATCQIYRLSNRRHTAVNRLPGCKCGHTSRSPLAETEAGRRRIERRQPVQTPTC